jgi:hypothetical protein
MPDHDDTELGADDGVERLDSPNQQTVRADGSGAADEGTGGAPADRGPDDHTSRAAPGEDEPDNLEPSTGPPAVGGGFDPAEHTVPEVLDHLEQHPDDADRVLGLERDGKARAGVLGHDE